MISVWIYFTENAEQNGQKKKRMGVKKKQESKLKKKKKPTTQTVMELSDRLIPSLK